MANIIPAILSDNIDEVNKQLKQLTGLVQWAQIDLMDQHFVDNISIKPEELKQIKTDINLEAHLMVDQPEQWLEHFDKDSFKRVYFHIEAVTEPEELIKKIKNHRFGPGLALNMETPITKAEPFVEMVSGVLFMAIVPGWQGQSFQETVLDKVRQFRKKYPQKTIAIDGGINELNIQAVVEAGVDNISVGSAIFSRGEVKNNIEKLKNLTV
jgi:ribulose-phosphate 3-epimerase